MRKENTNIKRGYNNLLGAPPYNFLNKSNDWMDYSEKEFIDMVEKKGGVLSWFSSKDIDYKYYKCMKVDCREKPRILYVPDAEYPEKKRIKGAAFKTLGAENWVLQQIGRNNCGSTCVAMLAFDNGVWKPDAYLATELVPSVPDDGSLIELSKEYLEDTDLELRIDEEVCKDPRNETAVLQWIKSGWEKNKGDGGKGAFIYTVGSHYIIIDSVSDRTLPDQSVSTWVLARDPLAGWQVIVPIGGIIAATVARKEDEVAQRMYMARKKL